VIFFLRFATLIFVIPRVHMNLSHVPDRTAEEIRLLVEGAVRAIGEATVIEGLKSFLVPPRREMRTWD
jgi:hypothetical protein